MATPLLGPKARFFDGNGNPLSGGKVTTYEAGTVTPKPTFTGSDGLVANTNPVILDAEGYANIWLGEGAYKIVLTDANDVPLWTVDNYPGDQAQGFAGEVYSVSTTTNIDTSYNNSVIVATGTISLNLLQASAAGEGFVFQVLNEGSGIVTIDPDGAELINGASTLVLSSGESALIVCDGTQWFATGLVANGSVTYERLGANVFQHLAHGQCYMSLSGGNLLLAPENGNNIIINGLQYQIPSAGLTLAPTGLVALTLYYIYIYDDAGTLRLEPSTTTHTRDTSTGIEIKTGNSTRTFVGWAYTSSIVTFVSTNTSRTVLSYFNPKNLRGLASGSGSTVGGGFSEIGGTSFRFTFISNGVDAMNVGCNGTIVNSTTNSTSARLQLNAATESSSVASMAGTSGVPMGLVYSFAPAEGLNYVTLFGSVGGGTGTYTGALTATIRG